MHRRLALEIALLMLVPTAVIAAEPAMGQVMLDNRTGSAAELYIDDQFACAAPAHGSCTASVPTGVHLATIQFPDGDYMSSGLFDLAADVPLVLPVRDITT
jgi:hypothetical protein